MSEALDWDCYYILISIVGIYHQKCCSKSIVHSWPALRLLVTTHNNGPGCGGTPARATEICNYDELKLKAPSGFKDYTWNNNANTAAITIKKPGLYWVEVIDQNNCKGKDSIAVNLKECITGFFIPTAFTPNNDGKNDVFKPLIFGNVKSYQFTIYNRWGEVVFKSTDIKKGWDGNFKSLSQSTNVFIWLCTYQLEGELKQTKKGTAVLIR